MSLYEILEKKNNNIKNNTHKKYYQYIYITQIIIII